MMTDTETIATLRAQLDSTLKDRARIMAERDTAKKIADAMEGEAHAHIKLWGDALRRAEAAEAKLAERDAENARLMEGLTVAASHLWFAASKMKGRCSGSDISAVSMAEQNARALLNKEPKP